MSDRPCTCHPDDNPPRPCPGQFALRDCFAAALLAKDEEIARLRAERQSAREGALKLFSEITALKTVMIAAAEEIQEHWDAHCDAEGYGPANLMRRLEDGIASEYGYTAGAFSELKQRAEAAEQRIRELEAALREAREVSNG